MPEQQQTLTIQQAIDLGVQHHNAGDLTKAEGIYKQILQSDPDQPVALHLLGVIAHQGGKNDAAVDLIARALALKPDLAEAHSNLGLALKNLGKSEDAIASYRKALALKPDFAEAHSNLGISLRDLGKPEEAEASYLRALDLKPDYAAAHSNLGAALCAMGRLVESKEAFDKGFRLRHGGPWWNAATFPDGDSTDTRPSTAAMFTSTFKLIDTIDQLEYLIAKARIDPSFQRLADRYHTVLAEIQLTKEPMAVTKLTPGQLERLGSSYHRVIHYAEAPRIRAGTVNRALDFKQIEDRYLSSPVSVTTLDDFLMPEALHGLRDFCLESTIFFKHSGNRFVSSRLASGFTCDLLYQVAEEVKERFPRVLGDHHLADIWIYRYNNQSEGVAAHTDEGAVTFNFWITPNDANRIPDGGGIIVYTKEQPYDWNWRHYNREKYTPAVSREIAEFLADADTITIPYRENRAVLFRSNLFHKSEQIHFRDGFENRRMNITLLFRNRKG